MKVLTVLGVLWLALAPAGAVAADAAHTAVLYKNPDCSCCDGHAEYLRENGYAVEVIETPDLDAFKAGHGIPEDLAGCHSIVIDGYVIEGHVPVAAIDKLLAERPAIIGISLPGMPIGSPGMGGQKAAPFVIQEIAKDGAARVFATE
jgi:hypothetical protein